MDIVLLNLQTKRHQTYAVVELSKLLINYII